MRKKILRASQPGKRPNLARLALEHRENDGSFTCDSLDGWAETATFVVFEADATGNPIAGTETDWKGDIEGTKITNAKITSGQDRDYPVNTVVMACETAEGRNELAEALSESLNPDGTFKAEKLDSSKIDTSKLIFSDGVIPGKAVKAGELDFPQGSIPMTALAGASGNESQSQIYTDAEIAKVKEKIDGLHEISRTGSYNDLKDKPVLKAKRTSRLVIGTASAGYTEGEVDYLCSGENDQVKINEAINSLPENGGKIVLLDGVYNIAAPVIIENKNNVMIEGSGRATQLKRMWDSSNGENAGVVTVKNSQNTALIAIQIDMNGTAFPSVFNEAVQVDDISQQTAMIDEGGFAGFLDELGEMEKEDWVDKREKLFDIGDPVPWFVDTGKSVTVGTSGADIIHNGDFGDTLRRASAALGPEGGRIKLVTDVSVPKNTVVSGVKNIQIEGEGGSKKVIDRTSSSARSIEFKEARSLSFKNVIFRCYCTIQANSFVIENVDFKEGVIFKAGRISAAKCNFENVSFGVYADAVSAVTSCNMLNGVSIGDNTYEDNGAKLYFKKCVFGRRSSGVPRRTEIRYSDVTMEGCIFYSYRNEDIQRSQFGSPVENGGIKSAIHCSSTGNITVKGSTFNISGVIGLKIDGNRSRSHRVAGNTFNEDGYASIGIDCQGRVAIVNNNLNTNDGVCLRGISGGAVLKGNTFNCGRCGAFVDNINGNLLVEKNKFSKRNYSPNGYLGGIHFGNEFMHQNNLKGYNCNAMIRKNSICQSNRFSLNKTLTNAQKPKISFINNSIKSSTNTSAEIIDVNTGSVKPQLIFKNNIVHGFSGTVAGMTKDDNWFSGNHFNDPEHPHIEEPENIPD